MQCFISYYSNKVLALCRYGFLIQVGSADIVRALLAAGANCTVKNTEDLNAYEYCQSDSMKNAYIGELMQAVSQSR